MKANDAILKNMQTNMTSLTNSNLKLKNMFGKFMKMNTASSLGLGTLAGNTITNPKEDLKGITIRRGTTYPGPTIPTTSSSSVVEHETKATKDTVHPTNNGSTEDVQPPVVPTEPPILNSEPVNSPIIEPVASPVSALKPNLRPLIPYPSRLHDQKLHDKANGANQGQNQPQAYQAPAYQAPVYQAPVHQPQIPQPQVVTTNEFTNFMKANDAILKNMQTNMTSLTNSNLKLKNMFGKFMKMNTASSLGLGTLAGNTITNPKEDLKGITIRRGTTYPGPTIPTTSSSSVVEHETKATKDTVHPTNNGSTEDVQPPVVPTEPPILNSEPVNSPIIEPVASPVSALKPNLRPLIPYPSRLHDQKLRDKTNVKPT
nr:hypothetical protein [Tanacetum cinerariifolium]